MSGVLRRGSLNFDCNLGARNARGSYDANLNGGYREANPNGNITPEISVINIDLRRYSEDLKKDHGHDTQNTTTATTKNLSDDIDSDIISNYIGHYRRWSFVWTFVLSLFQIPPSFQLFVFVFQTIPKNFWCARPENLMSVNVTLWQNLTQTPDGCSLLNLPYEQMLGEADLLAALDTHAHGTGSGDYTKCNSFEFSLASGNFTSLVEEFGLICDNKQLLSYVEMCYLAGAAVGSVTSGWISDRYGRKYTLMIFTFIQLCFGTLIAFSTSLTMFMTLRAIIGFASMTVIVVSFVLVVELVSGKWLTIIGILNILPVSISYVLAAGIAYYVREWRILQLAFTIPCTVLLLIWYCVPESPRWLLANGRLDELYLIIERAAKFNGTQLPPNYQKSIEAARTTTSACSDNPKLDDKIATNPATATATGNANATAVKYENPFVVVFGKLYLRTTCLTLVTWFTLIIIYFGLTLHFSNLGGNIYVNTGIAGIVEGISICASVLIVLKCGLRNSLIGYMLVPGICCLVAYSLPRTDAYAMWVIALNIIAKCVIGANNAIIPTYTAMQYHTTVRNFGVGMGNLASGVALIAVPFLWMLEHFDERLPMGIMGACGLVGALALVLMKDPQRKLN